MIVDLNDPNLKPERMEGEIFRAFDPYGDLISVVHRDAQPEGTGEPCPGCNEIHGHPAHISLLVASHDDPNKAMVVLMEDDEAAEMLATVGRFVFGTADEWR